MRCWPVHAVQGPCAPRPFMHVLPRGIRSFVSVRLMLRGWLGGSVNHASSSSECGSFLRCVGVSTPGCVARSRSGGGGVHFNTAL